MHESGMHELEARWGEMGRDGARDLQQQLVFASMEQICICRLSRGVFGGVNKAIYIHHWPLIGARRNAPGLQHAHVPPEFISLFMFVCGIIKTSMQTPPQIMFQCHPINFHSICRFLGIIADRVILVLRDYYPMLNSYFYKLTMISYTLES